MIAYSQRDPRWKDVKINGTPYTLGTDGCLICALSSIAGITPDVAVTKLRFNGAMVDWSSIGEIGLELVQRSDTYNNEYVAKFIKDNGQCIVRVDWDGDKTTTKDTHFVLFIGNQQEIDPWTGTVESTWKYPVLTGYRAVRRISMSDVTLESDKFEELVTKASRWDDVQKLGYTSAAQIEQEVKDLKQTISDKNNVIDAEEVRADEARKALNELITDCAKALNTVQEVTQIKAALVKATADLDTLDDLQRQYAELQLHSKEQVEELNAEIARWKAIADQKAVLGDFETSDLIKEVVRRLMKVVNLVK